MRDSSGEENIINEVQLNDTRRMKILKETIIKDSNNLNNLDAQNLKIQNQHKENKAGEAGAEENKNKNNTIETILQNINNSGIFKNISEISKREINFVEKSVKLDTDKKPKNTENFSQNEVNDEIRVRNMLGLRITKNTYEDIKAKNSKENKENLNEDLSSKLN